MSDKRRIIIIILSVAIGTIMSAGLYKLKRGTLGGDDYFSLATNLFFSLLIILGIGFMFIWKKKKE